MIAGWLVAWAASQHGDREAFIFEDRRFSFREANARANQLANALRAAGIAPGERVGVLMRNSVEAVDANFGLLKGGFASVPLNDRQTPAEHADILNDGEVSAVLAGPGFEGAIAEAAVAAPSVRLVVGVGWGDADYGRFTAAASAEEPEVEVEPSSLMRLTYTSGSTGRPKGVVGTWRRFQARLDNFFASLEYALGRGHSMLHVGPLSHVAGNYLLPCFMRGACGVVLPRFDPEAVLDAIERFRIDHALLVPTMIVRLVEAIEPGRRDLSSLKRINYGTAPIPVETLRRGIRLLGPVFRQHYGMSEANSPLTLLYPDEHVPDGSPEETARLASCGRPVAGLDIRVFGPDGRGLPPGEVGEIVIRSEGAAEVEYWRRPDLTAEAVRDGWFHTGDLGRFDEAGYLFIVGRIKDMIITGGFNVYAREVEDALYRHPAVLEAAVCGVQDPEWGEVVAAMIAPKPGLELDEAAVHAHCSGALAGYKRPRVLLFDDALPKTGSGKMAKQAIRPLLQAAHGGDAAEGEIAGVMARY